MCFSPADRFGLPFNEGFSGSRSQYVVLILLDLRSSIEDRPILERAETPETTPHHCKVSQAARSVPDDVAPWSKTGSAGI
jgi:hypothetical protein